MGGKVGTEDRTVCSLWKNVFLTNTREWRTLENVLDQQEFSEMAGYAKCVLMTECIYE